MMLASPCYHDIKRVNDPPRSRQDLVSFVSNITSQYSFEESNFVFLSTGQRQAMQDGVAPYVESCESLGLCRSGWAWDVYRFLPDVQACRFSDRENVVAGTADRS